MRVSIQNSIIESTKKISHKGGYSHGYYNTDRGICGGAITGG